MEVDTATLGFPRIGPNRELKFANEKFWRGAISQEDLYKVSDSVETLNWELQEQAGISRIAVGVQSLYDHVLDWTLRFGLEPPRVSHIRDPLACYFTMARGAEGCSALDMTKWFDTNYHYLVPEIQRSMKPSANFDDYLASIKRALDTLGAQRAVPVVLGPLTYISLSRLEDVTLMDMLDQMVPLYQQLLQSLKTLGVAEVQIHEPILVCSVAKVLLEEVKQLYGAEGGEGLLCNATGPPVDLVTFFDSLDPEVYAVVIHTGVKAISLDFTRGTNLEVIKQHGFPPTKRLGAGVVDGRSVWLTEPAVQSVLDTLMSVTKWISVQPSCSLLHLPYTMEAEPTNLPANLNQVLSFAKEKLGEVTTLAAYVLTKNTVALKDWEARYASFREARTTRPEVQKRFQEAINTPSLLDRPESFAKRRPQQMQALPSLLPTTTIGSFPQSVELRRLRRMLKKNEITPEEYAKRIDQQIAYNIGVQEALGLDLFVHGEPERTDMVEFFAEKLEGFVFTTNGWVQSFGSRCVRPPIIFDDLYRPVAMTVREFRVAQDMTKRPVKGMLTGPITILNWSFPRKDISRMEQAFQLALCIRDEIKDLEDAGSKVIQVDEPALREGMPLKTQNKDEYLRWAVSAFRLATSVAASSTSIHTHMCYADFKDCMDAILNMDADVNSIENSRSGNETLWEMKNAGYVNDIGPGLYDIHSPVVPSVDELKQKLNLFREVMRSEQIFVNPDCGLKTRMWPETIEALQNMVTAAREVRSVM